MIIAINTINNSVKNFSSKFEARKILNLKCAEDVIGLAIKGIIYSINNWKFNEV
jgi:hypothetical protein